MNSNTVPRGRHFRRRRLLPLAWVGGAAAAAVLVLGVTGTLSDWTTAVIHNDNSAGSAGLVVLQEKGPGSTGTPTTCTSTDDPSGGNDYNCTTINKYGDNGQADTANTEMTPTSAPISTTVTMTDTGTAATGFTLAADACAHADKTGSTSAGDLCDYVDVAIYAGDDSTGTALCGTGGTTPTTLNALFASTGGTTPCDLGSLLTAVNSTSGQDITFYVSLDANAPTTVAAETVAQGIDWTLST